ncbi:fibronectin type III domain-containing protein [Parapedobacter defluvii]|nr:hypothetical protein [Parapedobacter defluvii]
MKQLILAIFFLPLCAIAQDESFPLVLPGPDHTLVLVGALLDDSRPTGFLRENESFVVERADGQMQNYKRIGVVTFPASAAELEKRTGAFTTEILNKLSVRTIKEAYDRLVSTGPDTLGLLLISTEIQEALGLIFVDRDRDPGVSSSYRITWQQDGKEAKQMEAVVKAGLPTLSERYRGNTFLTTDSTVSVSWFSLAQHFEGEMPSFATVYRSVGDTEFQQVSRLLVATDGVSDSTRVYFSETVTPGQRYRYFMRVSDFAGNEGPASDTLYTIAVEPAKIARISNLKTADTLGGILLTWDPLPRQAVYGGVQILKSRQVGSDYVELDTIPATETRYLDTRVINATSYFYKVRPLILNLPGSAPLAFSEVSGYKKGVDSLPPTAPRVVNASVTPEGIKINWQPGDELDLFGYYVLRGTSATNMEVISSPVQDTVFVDTTFSVQQAGQLHYALQSINLHQVVSDTSEVASVTLRQPVVLTAPGGIQARHTVDGTSLQWDNVMLRDDNVAGFVVYRRKEGDENYQVISPELLKLPFFTDSTVDKTVALEYAVASVDAWGNQSILSPNTALAADQTEELAAPTQLYLRNLTAGIEVAWPVPLTVAGKQYVIYRKAAGQAEFSKIGTTAVNSVFVDKNVKNDTLYEYAVGVASGTAEGNRGLAQSIRRQ